MSMPLPTRTPLVVGAAVLVLACGGPSTEPEAPTAPTPGEVASPEVPEESAAPPAPAAMPHAKVLEVLPGRDDPADRRVHIEVFNPTSTPCTMKGYTLSWGSSSKEMPLSDATIQPGQSRQRFLIVHPRDGEIDTLTAEGATIDVRFECGP
jgi:hypothetical protein